MERIVMTWGYIPSGNKSNQIYCGDSESSSTIEQNFEIIENTLSGIDNDLNIEFDFKDLWDPDSNLYSTLSKHLEIAFSVSLKPNEIYDAYCLVNDEPNEGVNFSEIESSAGIFLNTNKKYNNKIFLRYYFEEEGEIYDEKVCVRDKD
ncbi:MAG: hypothetical protein ABGW83_07835 [Flavobacteriaceae bacterium]